MDWIAPNYPLMFRIFKILYTLNQENNNGVNDQTLALQLEKEYNIAPRREDNDKIFVSGMVRWRDGNLSRGRLDTQLLSELKEVFNFVDVEKDHYVLIDGEQKEKRGKDVVFRILTEDCSERMKSTILATITLEKLSISKIKKRGEVLKFINLLEELWNKDGTLGYYGVLQENLKNVEKLIDSNWNPLVIKEAIARAKQLGIVDTERTVNGTLILPILVEDMMDCMVAFYLLDNEPIIALRKISDLYNYIRKKYYVPPEIFGSYLVDKINRRSDYRGFEFVNEILKWFNNKIIEEDIRFSRLEGSFAPTISYTHFAIKREECQK